MLKRSGALSGSRRPRLDFCFRGKKLCLGSETKLMAILNVTPDSFSDGGLFEKPELAERRALEMEREGAHLLDIGGESSRPGARPVSAKEEIRRIRPVLKRLARRIETPLSVDTCKTEVAWAALDEGASVVNDIRALQGNRRLAKLIARYKAGVVLMHLRGNPRTMQKNTFYRDLLADIFDFLKKAVDAALDAGIPRSHIAIDPGFGFGKTTEQNLRILSRLEYFQKLKCPVLVGLSRKSMIGNLLGAPPADRLYGSLGAAAAAIHHGAHILRVHDVLPHKQLATVIDRTI